MSVGWSVFDGDWAKAIGEADERMYADKRRKDAARILGKRERQRGHDGREGSPAEALAGA